MQITIKNINEAHKTFETKRQIIRDQAIQVLDIIKNLFNTFTKKTIVKEKTNDFFLWLI
jgi:hypothetical protein